MLYLKDKKPDEIANLLNVGFKSIYRWLNKYDKEISLGKAGITAKMGAKNISYIKKKCKEAGGVIVFEDEASFRQDPTIFRSWFRCGCRSYVSTYGQRNTQHVYGAVSIHNIRFIYHFADTFNTSTHRGFLEMIIRKFYQKKIFLVEDNAKYNKTPLICSHGLMLIARRLSRGFFPHIRQNLIQWNHSGDIQDDRERIIISSEILMI